MILNFTWKIWELPIVFYKNSEEWLALPFAKIYPKVIF